MAAYRKKLIEVALPLDAINRESAREKSIRHGHPSTLHLWWARRPLAACRAVLFSSLVDDPDDDPMFAGDEDLAASKRAELFSLIEELVKWENSNNPRVINKARSEIARCVATQKIEEGTFKRDDVLTVPRLIPQWKRGQTDEPETIEISIFEIRQLLAKPEQVNAFLAEHAPPVLDPFAGGGSIPLEAQRLGLLAYARDLNPVPVLINRALIEIPSKFAGMPPVHPNARFGKLATKEWHGAQGLAEDVRYYGKWMREEAERRIGHLYPKVNVTEAMAVGRSDLRPYIGQSLTVIAWLWARTVKCANPACGVSMPMLGSFWLSKKKGREAYAEPILDMPNGTVIFRVRREGTPQEETSNRQMARCLFCGHLMKKSQLREQAISHGISEIPVAIVAEANRGRIYLDPAPTSHNIQQMPSEDIAQSITDDKRWFSPPQYGLTTFRDLFTPRQLATLITYSDLVHEAHSRVQDDVRTDLADKGNASNAFARDYADAVATYLGFASSKLADYNSSLVVWSQTRDQAKSTFGRQALPMVWDFAEVNPFAGAAGDLYTTLEGICNAIPDSLDTRVGTACQIPPTSFCKSV